MLSVSAGTIEIKSNTPNNVAFKVTGKSSHEKATSGNVSRNITYSRIPRGFWLNASVEEPLRSCPTASNFTRTKLIRMCRNRWRPSGRTRLAVIPPLLPLLRSQQTSMSLKKSKTRMGAARDLGDSQELHCQPRSQELRCQDLVPGPSVSPYSSVILTRHTC